MKRIIHIFLVLLMFITVISCEEEEVFEDFVDMEVYVPNWAAERERLGKVNINDWLMFMDLSQGATSHEWITADSTGIKFLKQELPPRNDNTDPHYLDFIDETKGTSSTDFIAPVIYTKPGLQGLRLFNTFEDSTGFALLGSVKGAEFDPETNLWVVDTTFVVDVYDSIRPAFSVKDVAGFDIPLNTVDTAIVTVLVGESLTFVDETTIGRPSTRTWTVPGASLVDDNAQTAAAIFNSVTDEDEFFIPSILSSRTGGNLPSGSRSAVIPLKIRVLPPVQNVEFLNLSINDEGSIIVEFNQGIFLPNTSDLNVRYGGVDINVTSVGYAGNTSAIALQMETTPLFGVEITLDIAALVLTSQFSTIDAPKLNDNAIAASVISEFGASLREDFESEVLTIPGTAPTADEWAVEGSVSFTRDSDGFEGSAFSFVGTDPSEAPNAQYVRTPRLSFEEGKTYIFQCQLKGSSADQVGSEVRFFLFSSTGTVAGFNHALTADYQEFRQEWTAPADDQGYFFRIGAADFNNSAGERPIKFKIDSIVVFEKSE